MERDVAVAGALETGQAAQTPRLPSSILGLAARLLVDIVAPLAAYYGLRALGVGQAAALVLCGLPTAMHMVYHAVKRRRIDTLAVFVMVIIGSSTLFAFLIGSPRFMLAKDGALGVAVGIGFLATLWFRRPLAFTLARALIEGARPASQKWDRLWEHAPRFRRIWNVSTVVWGLSKVVLASVHIVLAYYFRAGLWRMLYGPPVRPEYA